MNIPGLKDLRTTLPAIIAAASAFVLFSPDLFPQDREVNRWIVQLAKFTGVGGLAALGINAASTSKVIEKTGQMVDRKIEENTQ